MFRFLFLLSCAAVCLGQTTVIPQKGSWNTLEFGTLNGRFADPCHVNLAVGTACAAATFPDPSITVAIPSTISINSDGIPAPDLVFTGHNLNNVDQIGLSADASCGAIIAGTPITVTPANAGKTITILGTDIGAAAAWVDRLREFDTAPRALCYRLGVAGQWTYTGFKVKVIRAARVNLAGLTNVPCLSNATVLSAADQVWPMTPRYRLEKTFENTPCQVGPNFQQCYNPNTMACCGIPGSQTVYAKGSQRCCSSTSKYPIVQNNGGVCPCYALGASDFCPGDEPLCCLPTKYPELSDSTLFPNQAGQCYNASIHQCCDTGSRFDSGSSQCCVVNGVQSLDVACPCNSDSQCLGNYADPSDDANFVCCLQTNPVPATASVLKCDKYTNFPSGTGAAAAQTCLGSCISKKYQICCNGVACLSNVENCCNNTCCNKYVGTCARGRTSSADFGYLVEQCSTIEQMNTIKAFWIFVLPLELMFVSFLCLAIALAVAAKAKDTHEYSIIEMIMIFIAILTVLFCVPTYFAPIYKYGVVVFIAAQLAIVTAAARVKWLNVLCILVQVIAVIYLFDFVHGNYYLELAEWRNFATGTVDPASSGILTNIKKMWPSPSGVKGATTASAWCTKYYNFFRFDANVRDNLRFDNPEVQTFGYCSRAWNVALNLFIAGLMDFVILQLILSIIALVFRFLHPTYEAIAAEVPEKQL